VPAMVTARQDERAQVDQTAADQEAGGRR
jgi:hypothetical protein